MDSPCTFDIAADNKQEMREFVGRKKIIKTIERIEIIKEKHAGVNMFLPPWATDAYFESLHKQETKAHSRKENEVYTKYGKALAEDARVKPLGFTNETRFLVNF